MVKKVTRRRVDSGVAFHRLASGKKRVFDKRTVRVLGSLVVGMTLVSAILLALEPDPGARVNALSLSAIDLGSDSARQEILVGPSDLDWNYIIIHDSRGITGGQQELDAAWDREYARQGQSVPRGAGYHFVINDRFGQSEGDIEIARRWKDQLAGDYINGEQADMWNRQAIGICIMGDADNRAFSGDQIESTVKLVRLLQEAYGISRERVYVQTGRSAGSAGAFFPNAEFYKQIRE